MLTDEELPPLPEPSMLGFDVAEPPVSPHYSAGQMREYARAVEAAAYERAAKWVDKRADDYDAEFGSTDPETGAREYPGDGNEYVFELQEIAEAIRALAQGGKNDA